PPSVEHVIVARRCGIDVEWNDGLDHWWHDLVTDQSPDCPPEPMDSEDLLYLLYTSGTTAKPKGIMHTSGGYLTQVAFTHKYVFDLHADTDVYWCSADIGWVTGHSYIVYGPLCNGATSVMYEGTPDHPGRDDAQARLGHVPPPRHRRRSGRRRGPAGGARRRLLDAHSAVAGDAAGPLRRPRALPGHVLEPVRGPLFRRRRGQDRRRRIL